MSGLTRELKPLLLPLDGGRRLPRDVVDHAGDPRRLVDDPPGDEIQELVGQVRPPGSLPRAVVDAMERDMGTTIASREELVVGFGVMIAALKFLQP